MPKVGVEIVRTRTVTYEEEGIVQLDIPQQVIDDDGVYEWVENLYSTCECENRQENEHVIRAINDAMGPQSEDEEISWDHINVLDAPTA